MEDDLVMVEANAMDFVVTDLVILNKKDKVPPDYTVVSVISRLREFVKIIAFLILILFSKTDCVHDGLFGRVRHVCLSSFVSRLTSTSQKEECSVSPNAISPTRARYLIPDL